LAYGFSLSIFSFFKITKKRAVIFLFAEEIFDDERGRKGKIESVK